MTLAEALPAQMARVRDKVIPAYESVPMGHIAASAARSDLDMAAKAMIEGDLPAMIRVYESLKGWNV